MRSIKRWITVPILAALFLLAIPSLTPHVYGAFGNPCLTSTPCGITIVSPGSGGTKNNNQTVNPSFTVSFLVSNFTLNQPGTSADVNTVTSGGGAHNQGHIDVFVDNAYVTIWATANGIPLTVTPGTHTVRLDLVNDFDQEISPGVNATTRVNAINPSSLGTLQTTANNANTNASNAMTYSLGALAVSVITLILVAYTGFRPRKSM